jgi:hypothetical protein
MKVGRHIGFLSDSRDQTLALIFDLIGVDGFGVLGQKLTASAHWPIDLGQSSGPASNAAIGDFPGCLRRPSTYPRGKTNPGPQETKSGAPVDRRT